MVMTTVYLKTGQKSLITTNGQQDFLLPAILEFVALES